MTIAKIRAALETRLSLVTPAIPSAFENATYTPIAGTMYQRINLMPNITADEQIGSALYFERGIFQVAVCAPLGGGAAACEARAQLIKNAFKRGTSVIKDDVTVIITGAPSVTGGFVDGDRFCIPVSIRYQAQIQAI